MRDRGGIPEPDRARPRGRRLELGGTDLLSSLARWAAEARVDEAARARARESWLRRRQAEETSFAGVLADLAERGRPVVVQTATGRGHRGHVTAIGEDFVGLRTDVGQDLLVCHDAIAAVRTPPREAPAMSGRTIEVDLSFVDALVSLAGDRPRVQLGTIGDAVVGELREVGTDVATVRSDGEPPAWLYVPLRSIVEVAII